MRSDLKISNSTVLNLPDDVLTRQNADGTLSLLKIDDEDHFYVLNGVAAEFFQLIDGSTSLKDLKKILVEKYNPPARRFESDINKLLKKLRREKLLK